METNRRKDDKKHGKGIIQQILEIVMKENLKEKGEAWANGEIRGEFKNAHSMERTLIHSPEDHLKLSVLMSRV